MIPLLIHIESSNIGNFIYLFIIDQIFYFKPIFFFFFEKKKKIEI